MDIQGISTTAKSTQSTSTATSAFDSTDFQTFLTMLTTQLQNQDPLNPMESSDFAVQLATFSGVEQQVKTNQILESMATSSGLGGVAAYSGWLGKEAAVPVPAAYSGQPLTLLPPAVSDADSAVLVVQDAEGAVVARYEAAMDGSAMEWDALDASGQPLPAGTYAFTLQAYQGSTPVSAESVPVFQPVEEIRTDSDGSIRLVLRGGWSYPAESITALREPS